MSSEATSDWTAQLEGARRDGAEVVAVVGLGFVGTAVLASLARARRNGAPVFFVIGIERDDVDGRAKVASVRQGRPPVLAQDPALAAAYAEAQRGPRNVWATTELAAVRQCDVVLCCVGLDLERPPGQTRSLAVPLDDYAALMRQLGTLLRPGALVCVESTLPVGASERVLYPALVAGLAEQGATARGVRPLYAYCYERVMPGPGYLDSVAQTPRAFAGIDAESSARARTWLEKVVDVARHPLWQHKTIRAAEVAKLLENAYRAVNIAFIEEWARLAEAVGVDVFDVIASIRARRGTHDNMMRPGLGVGGYCLTKDAMLAAFGAESLLGVPAALPFSRLAILTNEAMPQRAVALAAQHFGAKLRGKRAALLGVTYRDGVADTRHAPTAVVAKALLAAGMQVTAWDPLVQVWHEVQEVHLAGSLSAAIERADLVVICLPDPLYGRELPALLVRHLRRGALLIDPWNLVADVVATPLTAQGIAVEVFGRGDLPRPAP